MCGRYVVEASIRERLVAEHPWRDRTDDSLWGRYNVSPSQAVPVARSEPDGPELVPMVWGFVPAFITGDKPRQRPINARAETVADKPFFRDAFRRRRCLLPASGWYEWQPGPPKIPHYLHPAGGAPLLFAGIWDHWQDRDRVAIIVRPAIDALGHIHDRMPVIVAAGAAEAWLSGEAPAALLAGDPPADLQAQAVSSQVNSPRNQGPGLIEPV